MNIHVIIPARSGSKRFPNKNIATFLGKPLFTHAINFALKLNFASKIIFTSDSEIKLYLLQTLKNMLKL